MSRTRTAKSHKNKAISLVLASVLIAAIVSIVAAPTGIKSAEAAGLAIAFTSPPQDAHLTSGLVAFAGNTASVNPVSKVEVSMDDNATTLKQATPKGPGDWSTWSISFNVPNGFHFFRATVTDSLAGTAQNSTRVYAYAPPTVAITSPANNAQVPAGMVTISGTAYSPKPIQFVDVSIDGNLSSYLRATPRSPATSSPPYGNWSTWSINYNIPSGSHWLTARVDDEMGRVAWNSITVVGTASNAPPTVAITSPANNAVVTPGTVTFSGTASSGATITTVDMSFEGGAYTQTTPSSPGNWSTWSIPMNIPSGSHWVLARVTDSLGRQAWNSITVVAGSPPTVAITSPANNAVVTPGTVTFSGTTSSGATITTVDMSFEGGAYTQTTPSSPGNWSTWSIPMNIPSGSHWVLARVTDSLGRQAWNSITVVAGSPPTVAITSPANNAVVTPGTVTFSGTASSGATITTVDMSFEGGAYTQTTPSSPGNWSTWSIPMNIPSGSHWVLARVTDSLGRQAWNSITVIAR